MGLLDYILKSKGATKAAEELGAPIWDRTSKEATSLLRNMRKDAAASARASAVTKATEAGYVDGSKEYNKLVGSEVRAAKRGAKQEWENMMSVRSGQSGVLPINTVGQMASSIATTPGIGMDMMGGAMKMGGAAMLGSMFYGGASLAMPNNVDVQNPVSHMFKAGAVGLGMGALYGASKGLVNAELAAKFTNVKTGAQMVSKAFENRLVMGAIGMAAAAGAGDINLTKPVNPVY